MAARSPGEQSHRPPSKRRVGELKKLKAKRRADPQSAIADRDPNEHAHWEFPVEWPLHLGEHGLPEKIERPEDLEIESICGGVDESQPVEQYDGTLGVTVAFVNDHQAPVGQIQWNENLGAVYSNPGNVSGVRWGTGTLIANDLFITAGHCFDQTGGGWNRPLVNGTTNVISPNEIAVNMHVNFNYQVDPAGVLRAEQQFPVLELTEYRLGGLDFAIIRLGGEPGATFGFTRISSADAAVGDILCVIQHPAGLPKRIEAGPAFHLHDSQVGYDSIDTLGGSSGSGILSPAGRLVGVHTNGGCNAEALSHNHGVRITSIISASPIVQSLAVLKSKFADDPFVFKKQFDDTKVTTDVPFGVVKKITDDPKYKFADDPGPFKVVGDEPDPLSHLGLGVQPAMGGGMAPFVLATPHHSMAWAELSALQRHQQWRMGRGGTSG